MKVTGVVLAGGESRRFGQPKAFAIYNGKYFYERICEALAAYVDEMIIVAHPDMRTRFGTTYQVIVDEPVVQGDGPLAGIYSAMNTIRSDWYCVLACDMPLIHKEIIKVLIKDVESEYVDAIIPEIDGHLQPLASMYHFRTYITLKSLLNQNKRKVKQFLEQIRVRYLHENDFTVDPCLFLNINTEEDYARLKGEAGE